MASRTIEDTAWCEVCDQRVLVRRHTGGHIWTDHEFHCTMCGTKRVWVGEARIRRAEQAKHLEAEAPREGTGLMWKVMGPLMRVNEPKTGPDTPKRYYS